MVFTTVANLVNWARSRSPWPLGYGLACCAIEMMATGASTHDMSRFGMEVFRSSPRQADVMIVAGTVTHKMAPRLRRLYEQMPEPKWVIAMGNCASSGGEFWDSYATLQGVDTVVPVDVYVPGCPPRPEQLIAAVMDIQDRIKKSGTLKGREFVGRTEHEGPSLHPQNVPPGDAVVAPGNFATSTRLQE